MTRRRKTYLVLPILPLMAGVLVLSCQNRKTPNTVFIDLPGEKTGVKFENLLNYSEAFNMIDYLYYYDGGGVALGDINNDGLIDIYLVSNEGKNALYLNRGNMKFEDISVSAGVESPGLWKTGVSMVDINGDGFLDIYLCRLGHYKGVTGKNELYINQGDLTFREEAANYNLDFVGFSTQAAFFDMDNDGDLDAYLLNHSVHTNNSFEDPQTRTEMDTLAGDRLYENRGQQFVDVTRESGIYQSQLGYGLGIGLSDINQDGFTDIFVANDFMENDFLYINNQDGTFTDVYHQMADYASLSSMGCDLADFNNDGLVDIITLDMLPDKETIVQTTVGEDPWEIFNMKLQMGYMPQYKRNMLQLNRGDGTFSDIAMMAGVHATDWSWAPLLADFDNDGWKDLFISNGIKGRPNDLNYLRFINSEQVIGNPDLPDSVLFNTMPSGVVSNYFFRNNADLTFEDVSVLWGTLPDLSTQGAAFGDLDNDGDLDLVLNNLDHPVVVKENTINHDSLHFLQLELIGTNKNSKAIGAKIHAYHNGQYQFQELFPVRGFKSSVDYRIHIGLGNKNTLDSLMVEWPGGGITTIRNPEADRILTLSQSESRPGKVAQSNANPLFVPVSNKDLGVDFIHRENNFVEFNREPLIPHMHSREGPALAVADVNQDGLDDFFTGGAKHQEGKVFIQTKNGFVKTDQPALAAHNLYEDVDAGFLDVDLDGDQDLVVVSGGNEFEGDSPYRQPRLYRNDGLGSLSFVPEAFDGIYQTGSCMAVHDFDQDGWPDIFLGSQVAPWHYGIAPKSYLLKNNGGQHFTDVSHLLPNEGVLGMINDAIWVDLEGNSGKSLVLAGEWMDISIISSTGDNFQLHTIPESSGWWKSIQSFDFDQDGDQDLLVGNLGLNSKLRASQHDPLYLYVDDFDQNGKHDPIMTITSSGKETIFNTEAQLVRQIPSMTSPDVMFDGALVKATRLSVRELRSGVYINNNQSFHFEPFPNLLQISPVRDILITDITANGSKEILMAGNIYPATMQEGRYAAGRAAVLVPQIEKSMVLSYQNTGISSRGDVRRTALLEFNGKELLAVAVNNDSILWFKRK